ncbi:hypothetical protein [Stenotrophomonas sp.]|uniref:hypothetical protein n=1 Tax=Stenotrophomonas sp. TaxID=69392 RepID=UPI00289FDFC8|nr:hypothetical protein [Stenotrophomonas sp.]
MDDADQYWQERDQDELYEFEQWLRDGGYRPNIHENREQDLKGPSLLLYHSRDPRDLPTAIWVCSGEYDGVARLIEHKRHAIQHNPLLQQCGHVIASPDDIQPTVLRLNDYSMVWDAATWHRVDALRWPRGVAQLLSRLLRELPPGRNGADSEYETIVIDMLMFVFYPELNNPRAQNYNVTGTQRRDAVFSLNPLRNSTWDAINLRYSSLNVVMEAKNYADTLGAPIVSSVAAYLGSTPGPIAILASRLGVNESGRKQIREIAMKDSKLVLSICDRDFREFLFARVNDLRRPGQRSEVDMLLGAIASASTQ